MLCAVGIVVSGMAIGTFLVVPTMIVVIVVVMVGVEESEQKNKK